MLFFLNWWDASCSARNSISRHWCLWMHGIRPFGSMEVSKEKFLRTSARSIEFPEMWPSNHLKTLVLHTWGLALFCVKISLGISQTLKFTSAPFRILGKNVTSNWRFVSVSRTHAPQQLKLHQQGDHNMIYIFRKTNWCVLFKFWCISDSLYFVHIDVYENFVL